jgi:hypothetical protein
MSAGTDARAVDVRRILLARFVRRIRDNRSCGIHAEDRIIPCYWTHRFDSATARVRLQHPSVNALRRRRMYRCEGRRIPTRGRFGEGRNYDSAMPPHIVTSSSWYPTSNSTAHRSNRTDRLATDTSNISHFRALGCLRDCREVGSGAIDRADDGHDL